MWHLFRWLLSWLTARPPINTWHCKPSIAPPTASSTEWICTAISRVGARTRTCNKTWLKYYCYYHYCSCWDYDYYYSTTTINYNNCNYYIYDQYCNNLH